MNTPVQNQFEVQIPDGQLIQNQTASIPAKMRFRMGYVSGQIWLPEGQIAVVMVEVDAFQFDVPGGTTTGYHVIPTTLQPVGPMSQLVFGVHTGVWTIGSQVVLTVERTGLTGTLYGQVTIAGELEDAP
jgi:hypothetical protein